MSSGRQTSPKLRTEIPYDYLEKITNDFSDDRKIRGSPFGTLYKGILPYDGSVIAVKKVQDNTPMPGHETFTDVVENVGALKHDNIVQIIAYCCETYKKVVLIDEIYSVEDFSKHCICYEYLPNGNLKEKLFGTKPSSVVSSKDDWHSRFKIINGICQGLCFLHNLVIPIHMDLRPENILFDANMVPKIADFGLICRVFGQGQTRLYTQTVAGSYGYVAPECLYRGEISAQSDIYSLGLMIIEITTREQNCPEDKQPSARKFIEKVRKTWTMEHIASVYRTLDSQYLLQVQVCIEIGLECVNIDQKFRPPIEKIIDRINGKS